MIHARSDYDRIQDPAANFEDPGVRRLMFGMEPDAKPIGKDEPVFLLRAQDKHMKDILYEYAELLLNDKGAGPGMYEAVMGHIGRVLAWQERNGCKSPDMSEGAGK